MTANTYKGEITADGKLIVELPEGIRPGPVEVIVVRSAVKRRRRASSHPAFGIWAHRRLDSAELAAELRQKVETRGDARD